MPHGIVLHRTPTCCPLLRHLRRPTKQLGWSPDDVRDLCQCTAVVRHDVLLFLTLLKCGLPNEDYTVNTAVCILITVLLIILTITHHNEGKPDRSAAIASIDRLSTPRPSYHNSGSPSHPHQPADEHPTARQRAAHRYRSTLVATSSFRVPDHTRQTTPSFLLFSTSRRAQPECKPVSRARLLSGAGAHTTIKHTQLATGVPTLSQLTCQSRQNPS